MHTVRSRVCVCCGACGDTVPFPRVGSEARLSPLAERSSCYTPLLCTSAVQRDSVRKPPEKREGGRWRGGGETETARLCTQQSAVNAAGTVCGACTVVCARYCVSCMWRVCALCYALLRVAYHAIHIPPWLASQGGYVCGCVVCVSDARARTCTQYALGVCMLWCMW